MSEGLSAQGFAVEGVGAGRTWINFSGTVSGVEAAFHTTIDEYGFGGELRHANSVDPARSFCNGPPRFQSYASSRLA